MSPYPPGFLLPELEFAPELRSSCGRRCCAPADAKPVGKWTVVKRKNGRTQWAYDGYPVYTSSLDKKAGDVFGGTNALAGGAQGVVASADRSAARCAAGAGYRAVPHRSHDHDGQGFSVLRLGRRRRRQVQLHGQVSVGPGIR